MTTVFTGETLTLAHVGSTLEVTLHRSVPGAEVYFFSNASSLEVSGDVQLRGKLLLELWDPHTGAIRPMAETGANDHGQPVTRFRLTLPALRSVFVVGRPTAD